MYFGWCILSALNVLLPFPIFLFVKSLLFSHKHNKMEVYTDSELNTLGYVGVCMSVFLPINRTSLQAFCQLVVRSKPLLSATEQFPLKILQIWHTKSCNWSWLLSLLSSSKLPQPTHPQKSPFEYLQVSYNGINNESKSSFLSSHSSSNVSSDLSVSE